MISGIQLNFGSSKHARFFILQWENKLFNASVLSMNDSRIHRNTKISRVDRALKLGCNDWCGLPLNASERTLGKALSCSLEGRWCKFCSWLIFHHHSCFVLFCFRFCVYDTSANCVWFLLPDVSWQSNWVSKRSFRLSISFSLWRFLSLLTLCWRKIRRLECL